MSELRLRFREGDQPDLVLGTGLHALGRLPTGLGKVNDGQPWLLQLCHDRRGIWMTVAEGLRGVHVNGRPVRQLGMLRPGDSVHVDGNELLLVAGNDASYAMADSATKRDPIGNLRLALRGIGGPHHGRSFSLETARWIGSDPAADIRIQSPGIASKHAAIEAGDGVAILHPAAGDVMVNGQLVRSAVLRNGDQIMFDIQHRFVVEGPLTFSDALPASAHAGAAQPAAPIMPPVMPTPHWSQRVPWLLLTAIALAGALWALLVFGAR